MTARQALVLVCLAAACAAGEAREGASAPEGDDDAADPGLAPPSVPDAAGAPSSAPSAPSSAKDGSVVGRDAADAGDPDAHRPSDTAVLPPVPVAQARPNVVLIYTDDQGYNDVGIFGSQIPTPNIDRLARRGVRFTNFYSPAPVCTPSRYGLLTGAYPARSMRGLDVVLMPGSGGRLDSSETTLATRLKAAGYRTALIGKWHLGLGAGNGPTSHGFETFTGHAGGALDYWTHRYVKTADWHIDGRQATEQGYATDLITKHAISFIDADRAKPFFLYLPYNAPHYGKSATPLPQDTLGPAPNTLQAPRAWVDKMAQIGDTRRRWFAAMVGSLDENIGSLVAHLERRGLMERTLIIFATDHGGDPNHGGRNAPYRGNKFQLLEGGIRVPAFMVWQGRIKADQVSDQVAGAVDIVPTVAKLAGASLEGAHPIDGVDLGPALFDGRAIERELFWADRGQTALRSGKWKLLGGALYDLEKDPKESRDVGGEHPDVLGALRARVTAHERAIAGRRLVPAP